MFSLNDVNKISEYVYDLLEEWHYPSLLTGIFSTKLMDIIVNGKDKRNRGKGYRAYLNTLFSISILKYLQNEGKYYPYFAIYDSPILSLKEGALTDNEMKKSLFLDLVLNYKDMQIIVIENEIPDIDYSNINLINFTKDKENGRYGLLFDVFW